MLEKLTAEAQKTQRNGTRAFNVWMDGRKRGRQLHSPLYSGESNPFPPVLRGDPGGSAFYAIVKCTSHPESSRDFFGAVSVYAGFSTGF